MRPDLATVREQLADRRRRRALVGLHFREAAERRELPEWSLGVLCHHCRRGHRQRLARVYVLPDKVLFSSCIPWLPSDQLTLRPWEHEALLADNALAALDDRSLAGELERLEAKARGHSPDGRRWLRSLPDRWVQDILTEPAGPSGWLPALWVRCRRHPAQVEALDRSVVLTSARRVGAGTPSTTRCSMPPT